MDKIPIVVGLDYHNQSVQVAIMHASHIPELLANQSLPNDAAAIERFAAKFGTVERCGIESCGGAANLAQELISKAAWTVDLAHSGIASRMKNNPDKSDYADSHVIADLERVGYLPKVWLAPERLREFRTVVRERTSLAKDQRRLKQQVGAVLREHRVTCPQRPRAWSKPWTQWAATVELPAPSRWVINQKLKRLQQRHQDLILVEAYLAELTRADPVITRLAKTRGIGPVTAWILGAYVGDFSRFKNGKQLARYCGLSPRNASSGQKQADAGLIEFANNDLRSALIEVAWCLIRYNPRWKTLANNLRARGKTGSIVAAAVANRFVRGLWREMTRPPRGT